MTKSRILIGLCISGNAKDAHACVYVYVYTCNKLCACTCAVVRQCGKGLWIREARVIMHVTLRVPAGFPGAVLWFGHACSHPRRNLKLPQRLLPSSTGRERGTCPNHDHACGCVHFGTQKRCGAGLLGEWEGGKCHVHPTTTRLVTMEIFRRQRKCTLVHFGPNPERSEEFQLGEARIVVRAVARARLWKAKDDPGPRGSPPHSDWHAVLHLEVLAIGVIIKACASIYHL
eukprot:jgi/Botrbrau1/7591/Bobra.0159s0040.1